MYRYIMYILGDIRLGTAFEKLCRRSHHFITRKLPGEDRSSLVKLINHRVKGSKCYVPFSAYYWNRFSRSYTCLVLEDVRAHSVW